ncbi:hypothetical protein [Paucibacter sp. Y2R2-4]|uniref:hypothetical protein n=1 Tax=Paucibacter sp. Y2R2-4 TaxID=2893553 RepID=UPI0021E47E71|nr:hypothetical protein [Paucibacter sp. Y2R2-4]MCV2349677.1 hypothetical protein [Paucibacter sp. Y2R2-4]
MSAGLHPGPAGGRSRFDLAAWQASIRQRLNPLWLRLPEPAQRLLQKMGWPGGLATLLSLVAMILLFWALPAQERALGQQREALSERRLALKQQGQRQLTQDPQTFLQSLPPDSARQARTAALLALATEIGLPWPRSEFRYQAEPALGLAQYRIAMNANGNYEQLRRYVQEALQRDPALSLESIKLRRLRPSEPMLSAELSWVFYMQMPQTAKAHAPAASGVQP